MSLRSFVGSGSNSSGGTPIKGVDGVIGVCILLSYLVGGKNLFPNNIVATDYLLEMKDGDAGSMAVLDEDQLSELIAACSEAIRRPLKGLSLGSLKVYLSNLRNGLRPNGGVLPAVANHYSQVSGRISIGPRNYDQDCLNGSWDRNPDWIKCLH